MLDLDEKMENISHKVMTKVPIVFCFDDRLILPAGVCVHSLLFHAGPDTYYDIFIFHSASCSFPTSGYLEKLYGQFDNFSLTYMDVGHIFSDAFEIRNITSASYYRLLIPKLITHYDKVMYHDVDVIFREDQSHLFFSTDMSGYYVAGVNFTGGLEKSGRKYLNKLDLDWKTYILSGNVIFNLALMRQDGLVQIFEERVKKSTYIYQDMDIINIVCKGKIKRLPPTFCGTVEIFGFAARRNNPELYTTAELADVLLNGTIHYNGVKPWQSYCPNMDIWWEYYRKSVFYEPEFYYNFFFNKLDEYDRLPLLKRIKILARYFINGKLN